MTDDIAVILLNMSVFLCLKSKNTVFFKVKCFIYMYIFRVPNWPKIGIFLGLGFR